MCYEAGGGLLGSIPQSILMAEATNFIMQGFACCKMIFYSCYPDIRFVIEPLILINASIEERVRIKRARRARLIEELDSYYMYSPFQ